MRNITGKTIHLTGIIFFLILTSLLYAQDTHPLMRYPDICDDLIAFSYARDIWTVPVEGGTATRLTVNEGEEYNPKFSPDGSLIAFSAEYDGNDDVYVMDRLGGNIKRLTFHPESDVVVGWNPANNKIIFNSTRKSGNDYYHLFMVAPDGTGFEEVPVFECAVGSFSPDGRSIAYNRVNRLYRTWKRYFGGTASDIYLYEFETGNFKRITDFKGEDRLPMWIGDKIYFSSDRNGTLNIFSYDLATHEFDYLTQHKYYDVRFPSDGAGKIVYELGGTLRVLDLQSGQDRQVDIRIGSDAPEVRPYLRDISDLITEIALSPSGQRALLVARGEIFNLPAEEGTTLNLSHNSGSREKDAVWSPDGSRVAYISDVSGEYEIYVIDSRGESEPIKLTTHTSGYRHALKWSPDSKKLAYADETLRCYYLDIATRKITQVDKADYEHMDVSQNVKEISDFSWSPDSRYIAYSKMNEDLLNRIYIYSLEENRSYQISNDQFSDFNPVFTPDGEHLIFISNRRFEPVFCDFEWEMVYKKIAGIYDLILRRDGQPIFPYKNDGDAVEDTAPAKDTGKKDADKTIIDFDGLYQRIEAFPLENGNYRSVTVNDDFVFYLNGAEGDYNPFEFRDLEPRKLYAFSIEDREEKEITNSTTGYVLSADGNKILYRSGDRLVLINADNSGAGGDDLDLSGVSMLIDPRAEWTQIFNEAWRLERDYFYDPGMNGVDWPAMKEKYGSLVKYASCRQDIEYLIGELIGELSCSHTYVYDGENRREAEPVSVGMLGADYAVDAASNRYKIEHIIRTTDWTRGNLPPLNQPGVNINEGDYILRVNNREVTADSSIYSYFQNLANQLITLTVNDKPTLSGAREVLVKPTGGEFSMRFYQWAERNRQIVDSISGSQLGYMYFPDTYTSSAREFARQYYGQTNKKGLVIDARNNGGGLGPEVFLHRLQARPLAYWTRRYSHDQVSPYYVSDAYMVCVTDRHAGSGGDEFPYQFRLRGMGPVIGTRTWGGLVGISTYMKLVDGGEVTVPDYRIYSREGKWVVENEGVIPDITVDLNPAEMARGYDAQLHKAIELLQEEIRNNPREWPRHEPFPSEK